MNQFLRRFSASRRTWLIVAAVATMLLVLTTTTIVMAMILPSTFNAADGNLEAETYPLDKDWENLGITCPAGPGIGNGCVVDQPTGTNDNAFGQGSKEDSPVPTVVFGSIPNNKSDLLRFYIYDEKVSNKDFLYLGWVRVNDPRGTTNMDFELNQNKCEYVNGAPTPDSSCSANGVTPERMEDDLLILYDWSGGGTNPSLSISMWIETSASKAADVCEASNSFPCWGKRQDLSGNTFVEASVNDLTLYPSAGNFDPIVNQTIGYRTFGEASIDLTDLGIFPVDQCVNYGSAYLKSRSSDSFSSELKDFIAPIPVNVSNCGSLTVIKDAQPDDAQDFAFSLSNGTTQNFTLDDDGDGTHSNFIAFNDLFSGNYDVTETPVEGWDLTSITCVDDNNNPIGTVDLANSKVSLSITADDAITCTFTNQKDSYIIVDKVTDPSGDPQSFTFDASWIAGTVDFSLTDAAPPFNSGDLAPGTYMVSEAELQGWDLTSATCDDGSNPSSITLSAGETVICTFSNTKLGKIIVVKQTNPDGAPGDFSFTGDLSGTISDGENIESGYLDPGSYSTTESDPTSAGFLLTGISCDDENSAGNTGTRTATFNVEAGETVTCTFTNATGAIQVTKLAKDASKGAGDHPLSGVTFTLSGGHLITNQVDTTDGDGLVCFDGLVPGMTYSVEETVPDGYQLAAGEINPREIVVTAGATCSIGNPDKENFYNIPLSEIEVIFRSLAGEGITVAKISCVLQEGENSTPIYPVPDDVTPDDLDDTDEVITDLLPGNYVCTVVVDP